MKSAWNVLIIEIQLNRVKFCQNSQQADCIYIHVFISELKTPIFICNCNYKITICNFLPHQRYRKGSNNFAKTFYIISSPKKLIIKLITQGLIFATFRNSKSTLAMVDVSSRLIWRQWSSSTENASVHLPSSVIHVIFAGPSCTDARTRRDKPTLKSKRSPASWRDSKEPLLVPLLMISWRRETKSQRFAKLNVIKPSGKFKASTNYNSQKKMTKYLFCYKKSC